MSFRTTYITTLLATGAAVVALAAAPIATAAPTTAASTPLPPQPCSTAGAGSECQSPGNVQIYDSPPPVSYEPYGGYGMALGVGQG
jgi:hypothetical protein